MARYALVEEGVVVNVVIWDGETDCAPLEGALLLAPDSPVGVGYLFDGNEYSAPAFESPVLVPQ